MREGKGERPREEVRETQREREGYMVIRVLNHHIDNKEIEYFVCHGQL